LSFIKNTSGQSLVELIVALAIFSIVVLSASLIFLDNITALKVGNELTEATSLVQEGLDASRSIRDNKFSDLSNGPHGVTRASGYWEFSGSSDTTGIYTRVITISDVERDEDGNVVASDGTVDVRTKKVLSSVSWDSRGSTRSTSALSYLTDWNVYDWAETNDTEFGAGTVSSTSVTGVGAGASIQLIISTVEGITRWVPGGGSSFINDTDTDFGAGSTSDTTIFGTNISAVVQLSTDSGDFYNSSGTFISQVFDSGSATTVWNTLNWVENNYLSTDVTFATRTGNSAVPDAGWTGWSPELIDPNGSSITSSNNQYLQYRITLTTSDSTVSPAVDFVSIGYGDPDISSNLYDLHMTSELDGRSVGSGGEVMGFDQDIWTAWGSPTPNDLYGVHLVAANDGWAVGQSGYIAQWDGATWSYFDSPTSNQLNSVSLSSTSAGWAVGDGGVIIEWDGVDWTTASSPTVNQLNAISTVSPSDIWAVGDSGTIIHFNGSSWFAVSSPTAVDLRGVYMVSSSDGWAVGSNGKILRYSNGAWSVHSTVFGGSQNLNGIFMNSESDGWIVGNSGGILNYNGSAWLIKDSPTSTSLHSVYTNSETNGWIVGDSGMFLSLYLTEISGYVTDGTFTSQVLDSDSADTDWQTLFWNETLPTDTDITVAVRSGNAAVPDATWSAFSSEYTDSSGIDISSQAGRYFQYRATLSTTNVAVTPALGDVVITYK